MKKFWLFLLSLGLLMAFSASAFAVDVQVSGSYYVGGLYLNKIAVSDNGSSPDPSTAFFYQRLRVETDFIVSPGLKLITRFDALERVWGGSRSNPGTSDYPYSIATMAEEQNIAFNLMYVEYTSPIGLFQVGYIHDNNWGIPGNTFGKSDDNGHSTAGIQYIVPIGSLVLGSVYYMENDQSYSAVNSTATTTDADWESLSGYAIYFFNHGSSTGIIFDWNRKATDRPYPGAFGGNLTNTYVLAPYVQYKSGPVLLEAEFAYGWGSVNWEDGGIGPTGQNVVLQTIGAYLNANYTINAFYIGGQFAYVSGPGNDPNHVNNFLGAGNDWNPCLIMFNNDLTYWVGPINGYSGTSNSSVPGTGMTNADFYQLYGGVHPTTKWDIKASVSYAAADTVPTGFTGDKTYGTELDVTATYKITNNLSYMLGAGYWWVGSYYKGATTGNNNLDDDYMLLNKLTLTF